MMSVGQRPPSALLMQLITGKFVTQMVATAAHLKIADRLKDGPASAEDVAKGAGTDPSSTYRLLRGLSSVGVLVEHEAKTFSLTPVGECLRSDVPGSLAGLAKFIGEGWHSALWAKLPHCIATGESGFKSVHGSSGFDWLNAHPKEFEVYNEALTSIIATTAKAVAATYDFSGSKQIVDLGGGHGLLLAEVLAANPQARGILFDSPPVIEATKRRAAEQGLSLRFDTMGGDFFESVPPGCDTYLLKHVLHNWADEQSVTILGNVARSMARGARVLVLESVMTPPGTPHFSKVLDLDMLVMTQGGRERTEGEYGALFARAGLKLARVTPTPSSVSIVEATHG